MNVLEGAAALGPIIDELDTAEAAQAIDYMPSGPLRDALIAAWEGFEYAAMLKVKVERRRALANVKRTAAAASFGKGWPW